MPCTPTSKARKLNELTWRDKAARDRSIPITLEKYRAARERLIQSRATHLDQLTDKLKEPRVHKIIAALIRGETVVETFADDDVQYVTDLGLITNRPQLRISNRIYQEVIPRELTWTVQVVLTHQQSWYINPDHQLTIPKLLAAFQQYFREHSQAWLERFDYKEVGPQLLLQAFLQRIVIELNLLRKSLEKTIEEGVQQTADYAQHCQADEAHLLIFDQREEVSWDDKIWRREEVWQGRSVTVWGA